MFDDISSQGACPTCAAPLNYKLKTSVQIVCTYCGSLVVRSGQTLENYGTCSEVLVTPSVFQLGTSGVYKNRKFEVVGRRQVTWSGGFWEEWYLFFSHGESWWLAEAQGGFSILSQTERAPENISDFSIGSLFTTEGRVFCVIDQKEAVVSAVEGELPSAYHLGLPFRSYDCASTDGHLCTLDFSNPQQIACYEGEWVLAKELNLQNTRSKWKGWE